MHAQWRDDLDGWSNLAGPRPMAYSPMPTYSQAFAPQMAPLQHNASPPRNPVNHPTYAPAVFHNAQFTAENHPAELRPSMPSTFAADFCGTANGYSPPGSSLDW